ncbi:MAG: hypothetical protein M3Q16_01295 [Pseudomonadota bacterium]|nr:hypothetical protein [Pseudomonadota bacterium]
MEKKDAPSPGNKEPNEPIKTPDISVLERYSPTGGAQSHPDWVKTKFPTYVASHGGAHGHEATSVRQLTHKGHDVKIITTYRIEVDGKPAGMHLSVDEEGQVYTHATPFVTYGSAVDLMKSVMDAYPDAFSDSDPHAGHDHGDNHEGDHS